MVMNKTMIRLMFRKMRHQLPQLIGMGLLVLIGAAFFVTLYTIYLSYDEHANQLFTSQGYADVTYYGSFDGNDVTTVEAKDGIRKAHGRIVQDFREKDVTLRVISLTDGINMPYIYNGILPKASNECAVIKKHAEARDIGLGDTIMVNGQSLKVTAIVASPEYVYLSQNERALMAEPNRFGVIFVVEEFFEGSYTEIVALGDIQNEGAVKTGEAIGAVRTVMQKDQLNYVLFEADLKQIRTFAFIFPLIFALLIIVIIYVMIKRTIALERRQIGVCKALGVTVEACVTLHSTDSIHSNAGAILVFAAACFVIPL
jgi:putative ABC transport system permease protein